MIGRTPQSHIYLPDQTVSREHAVLNVSAQQAVTLTDLNSRNGTWVDNVLIQSTIVRKGQEIRFGNSVFVLSGAPNNESAVDLNEPTDLPQTTLSTKSPAETLKPRQLEVLEWLLQGLNEKEVAAKLGIARDTVHNHIRAIYAAFHVHSRVELLLKVNPIKSVRTPMPDRRDPKK